MSFWTQICGAIDVEAGIDCIENLEKFISNLPKIKGSEGEVEFYVNKLKGYNYSTSADCNRCKYRETLKYHDKSMSCESPEDFKCPKGEYQTRCIVSIVASLRDRMVSQVNDDLLEILNMFNKEFYVRTLIVTINDGIDTQTYTLGDLYD